MRNVFLSCILFLSTISIFAQQSGASASKNFTVSGDWCSGSYSLTAKISKPKGTWQWSKNGVILENENSETINLTKYGTGTYVAMFKKSNNKVIYFDSYEFTSAPGVMANFEPVYMYAAAAVHFKNLTTGENSASYKWLWDFGDGVTSTDLNPIHLYENEGLYKVSLTVTDDKGCSHTLTKDIVWQYLN